VPDFAGEPPTAASGLAMTHSSHKARKREAGPPSGFTRPDPPVGPPTDGPGLAICTEFHAAQMTKTNAAGPAARAAHVVRRDFNPMTRRAASLIAKILKGLLSYGHLAMTIRVPPELRNRKTPKQRHGGKSSAECLKPCCDPP
jgi:hypothetical protein